MALLTFFAIHLADRAVVREVNARVRTTSAVTGALLRQQMQGVADLTASYASRPVLIKALADGYRAAFDRDAISRQLAQLQAAQPGNGGVFLTDADCRLTNVESVPRHPPRSAPAVRADARVAREMAGCGDARVAQ